MYILFPGRHHILTEFQFKYLFRLLHSPNSICDIDGKALDKNLQIDALIIAVTSANHSGTKRNPLPFHLRAMMLQDFSREFSVPSYVFGINDVGHLTDFAGYTLKTIAHESDRAVQLTPDNTLVVCSTPVLAMYKAKGFRILPAELINSTPESYSTPLPWYYIEQIVATAEWKSKKELIEGIHLSSFKLWDNYGLADKVRRILKDPIIGDDGDITASRDYNTYVRQMDEIAELKYNETAPFIKAGNIGDIGCAVGSWIKLACEDRRFSESDFYGIEVARQLYDICHQRKHNGEFTNPSVFFTMKNAVTDLVFDNNSMDTIHTSSLTHEIESYGNRNDLLNFIKNRYNELKPGGVWINRDVVGPEEGNKIVYMLLNANDGSNNDPYKTCSSPKALKEHLDQLSTYSRFLRFAQDFRQKEGQQINYTIHNSADKTLIALPYKDAADFMLTKDYTDNWESEMHETFCFWSYSDWIKALEQVGFVIRQESKSYQNPWIFENRWVNKVALYLDQNAEIKCDYPPSNMLMIAEKV